MTPLCLLNDWNEENGRREGDVREVRMIKNSTDAELLPDGHRLFANECVFLTFIGNSLYLFFG